MISRFKRPLLEVQWQRQLLKVWFKLQLVSVCFKCVWYWPQNSSNIGFCGKHHRNDASMWSEDKISRNEGELQVVTACFSENGAAPKSPNQLNRLKPKNYCWLHLTWGLGSVQYSTDFYAGWFCFGKPNWFWTCSARYVVLFMCLISSALCLINIDQSRF